MDVSRGGGVPSNLKKNENRKFKIDEMWVGDPARCFSISNAWELIRYRQQFPFLAKYFSVFRKPFLDTSHGHLVAYCTTKTE